MIYKDFDLLSSARRRISRAGAELLGGAGHRGLPAPFSDVELENFLLKLGRTTRVVRRIESTEMTTAKSFGAALFNAVFAGDVRACLRSAVDEARRENTRVRLRIRLADPVLADLPEFLYNPAVNRFLALSVQTPLVRYMELPEVIQPVAVTPPIRVLVMISSPSDYPALDVEAEWTRLNESLADLISAGTIAVERLDDATLSALQRRLRRSQHTSFISSATANSTRRCKKGAAARARQQAGHRIGSQYLGMLHDQDSLRLAILNACEGARSSRQDPFAGSAQSLVQQGIPAVIAMQFEIADDVASTFAHEFYGALADGLPIDASVTEARKAIFAGGREIEWATPVLYLRAPDGRIFDVAPAGKTAAPVTAPEPATSGKVTVTSPAAPVPATPRERAAALLRAASRLLALGNYKEAMEQLVEARPLDPDSATLAELTATAEEQRAVADTRELLKQRGGRATIAEAAARPRDRAPAAKADTRRANRPAGASGRPTTRAI